MKIAFCINTAWNIYNFRKDLILEFLSNGDEVHCIAPPDGFEKDLKDLGCHFHPIELSAKSSNPFKDLKFAMDLSSILISIKADVLLSYTIKPNIYSSLFFSRHQVPIIANISGLGTTFIRNNLTSFFAKKLYRVSLKRSKRVFFQNVDDLELFQELGLVNTENIDLVPGSGIDLAYFDPQVVEKVHNEGFTFLMLSRIIYDKGIREYMEAVKKMREQGLGFDAILCGKIENDSKLGPDKDELEKMAKDSGIVLMEFSKEVRELIASSDCVVLPSYREGLPKSLLEGGAMAKPLISCDVPGCREVVKDGSNGFLCSPMDAGSLAEKMKKLLSLDRSELEAMGHRSREIVGRNFSKEIVIKKYKEAIKAIC